MRFERSEDGWDVSTPVFVGDPKGVQKFLICEHFYKQKSHSVEKAKLGNAKKTAEIVNETCSMCGCQRFRIREVIPKAEIDKAIAGVMKRKHVILWKRGDVLEPDALGDEGIIRQVFQRFVLCASEEDAARMTLDRDFGLGLTVKTDPKCKTKEA
jgi:hypothetical protein